MNRWIDRISMRQLLLVASVGGFGVAGTGFYFRSRIEQNIKKSEYYSESLKILRAHKGIAFFMGAPIYESSIDIDDRKNNFCTETEARFEVPVKGSKKSGIYYIFASREGIGHSWNIQRLELGIDDTPGKRILLLDNSK